MEVDAATLLPSDDSSRGFDNQAGTLGLSPVLLEAYLSAAGKISRLAIGGRTAPTQTVYRVADDATQNDHVEGLSFGTRGGILIHHEFPADGDYAIRIEPVNMGNMGNNCAFGEVGGNSSTSCWTASALRSSTGTRRWALGDVVVAHASWRSTSVFRSRPVRTRSGSRFFQLV